MTLNCVYATNSMSTGAIYQVEANGNTNASMDFLCNMMRISKMKITDAKYQKIKMVIMPQFFHYGWKTVFCLK